MRATQRYRQASRAALVGLLANLALGGLKLTVGVAQQSFALIADAVNSLGDGLASLVVLASFRVSQRPPDAEHPYGHSKAEGIAASNVAVLVVLSGVLVGVEALRRFDVVHPAPTSIVLWIAGGNAIIKEGLFRYKMAVGKRVGSRGSRWDPLWKPGGSRSFWGEATLERRRRRMPPTLSWCVKKSRLHSDRRPPSLTTSLSTRFTKALHRRSTSRLSLMSSQILFSLDRG